MVTSVALSLRERDVLTDKTQSGGETLASVSVSPFAAVETATRNVSGLGAQERQSRGNEMGKRQSRGNEMGKRQSRGNEMGNEKGERSRRYSLINQNVAM
ncbi:hypothetical protein PFLUV_G00206030 [Perca fluviatilis]|uniref:Uncharacterized protein n=1 Tax=Perca fluviatilis TaxID=8168 RepID=A0A6A5EUS7_PERFL|nr:hypothetical protein PFLUV_G00206030 [Perca fluviatilis]